MGVFRVKQTYGIIASVFCQIINNKREGHSFDEFGQRIKETVKNVVVRKVGTVKEKLMVVIDIAKKKKRLVKSE